MCKGKQARETGSFWRMALSQWLKLGGSGGGDKTKEGQGVPYHPNHGHNVSLFGRWWGTTIGYKQSNDVPRFSL